MERTQISLTPDQMRRLRQAASERGVSMAQIVRDAVEAYVAAPPADRDELVRRARAVAGRFASGMTDVSARHDDYLAEDPTGW